MVGAWQQEVRHGAGAVSWVLRSNPQSRLRKTANWRWHGHWTPVPCFQKDCPSESFPNSSSNWGVSIQKHEPTRAFLIQTTTLHACVFVWIIEVSFPEFFQRYFLFSSWYCHWLYFNVLVRYRSQKSSWEVLLYHKVSKIIYMRFLDIFKKSIVF